MNESETESAAGTGAASGPETDGGSGSGPGSTQGFRAQDQITQDAARQRLQGALVALSERAGQRRKQFEHAHQFRLAQKRHHHYRTHAEPCRGLGIHPRIRQHIVSNVACGGSGCIPRKFRKPSRAARPAPARSNRCWRGKPFLRSRSQHDRSAGGARSQAGLLHHFIEDNFQRQIRGQARPTDRPRFARQSAPPDRRSPPQTRHRPSSCEAHQWRSESTLKDQLPASDVAA